MLCPICNSSKNSQHLSLYDDRYGHPDNYQLLECSNCLHRYIEHEFSNIMLANLYSEYYPRRAFNTDYYRPHKPSGWFFSLFNREKSKAYRWVPENIKILDIGCGTGESLGFHTIRGCEAHGTDTDIHIEVIAKKLNLNIKVGEFNPKNYPSNYFDYITLEQVVEHVNDPAKLLSDLSSVLKDNGKIIITTPNANSFFANLFKSKWIHWHAPYHLHFFSDKSLKTITESLNLSIIYKKTITNPDWIKFQLQALLVYPKKGESSPFWSNKSPTRSKKLQNRLISLSHTLKFTTLISCIFDFLGHGDNNVIIISKNKLL